MNKLLLTLFLFSFSSALAADIVLPNLKKSATGTTTAGKNALDVNIASGTVSFTEDATVANGGTLPAKTKVVSGYDGAAVRVLKTDSSGRLDVTVNSSALPTGAATEATLSALNGKVTAVNTGAVVVSSSALPSGASTSALQTTGNSSLSSIDGKITAVNTGAVVVSSSALPSGASTSAKQDTGNTSLSSIDGKITAVNTGAVVVSSSALPTGAATEATLSTLNGKVTAVNTGAVTISSALPAGTNLIGKTGIDQTTPGTTNKVSIGSDGTITLLAGSASIGKFKVDPAVTGSGSGAAATVSTVATLTAPANCIGFVLMNLDTSSANVRWAVGRTASTTLGQQLQPGRDTGFVPIGASVSIIAESGTQNIDIQWIAQ